MGGAIPGVVKGRTVKCRGENCGFKGTLDQLKPAASSFHQFDCPECGSADLDGVPTHGNYVGNKLAVFMD